METVNDMSAVTPGADSRYKTSRFFHIYLMRQIQSS